MSWVGFFALRKVYDLFVMMPSSFDRYLIDAGANVNAQTSTGDTALTYACENGHTDVADLLLQAGANLVSLVFCVSH